MVVLTCMETLCDGCTYMYVDTLWWLYLHIQTLCDGYTYMYRHSVISVMAVLTCM